VRACARSFAPSCAPASVPAGGQACVPAPRSARSPRWERLRPRPVAGSSSSRVRRDFRGDAFSSQAPSALRPPAPVRRAPQAVPLPPRRLRPRAQHPAASCGYETSVVPRCESPRSVARGQANTTAVPGLALRMLKTVVMGPGWNGSRRPPTPPFPRSTGRDGARPVLRDPGLSRGRRPQPGPACANRTQPLGQPCPRPRLELGVPRLQLPPRGLEVLEPGVGFFELQQLLRQLRVRHRPSHDVARGAC